MRIDLPLLPLTLSIERRRYVPYRPRITVRGLMVVVVVLALYLGGVSLPSRKQRYQLADQQVCNHLALLGLESRRDRDQERELRTQFDKDIECAEKEEQEAATLPASSDDAKSHREIAALWLKAAREVPLKMELAGRRARAVEQWVDKLQQRCREAQGSLDRYERFAREIRDLPTSAEWTVLGLGSRIEDLEREIQAKRRAKAIRAMVDANPELGRGTEIP